MTGRIRVALPIRVRWTFLGARQARPPPLLHLGDALALSLPVPFRMVAAHFVTTRRRTACLVPTAAMLRIHAGLIRLSAQRAPALVPTLFTYVI